jgi:O-antigen/teichoic acid export membrane protein
VSSTNLNTFLKHTVRLATGTALGQIIVVASAPILSRLYTPEMFGTFGLFNAVVITLATISGFRFEFAILLPGEDRDGYDLLRLQLLLTLLVAILMGLLCVLIPGGIARGLGDPDLGLVLWMAGPAILLFGGFNGLNFWNTRQRHFGRLAKAKVAGNLCTVIGQIATASLWFPASWGLIGGLILGKGVEDGLLWSGIRKQDRRRFDRQGLWANMKRLASRYRKFPQYHTGSSLINTLAWQLPPVLLALFFNTGIVGFYVLGERVIRVPMNVVGKAISQVFFRQGTDARREGTLATVFVQTVRMLSIIGLLPSLILTILGRDLFVVVLGPDWAEAGVFVQILAPWAFVWFLSSPLSTLISIQERQETGLIYNTLVLFSRTVSLLVGGWLGDARIALLLFSVSGLLSYGSLVLWTGRISGVSHRETFRAIQSVNWRWFVLPVLLGGVILMTPADPLLPTAFALLYLAVYYYRVVIRFRDLFTF